MCWNTNELLASVINNIEDGSVTFGWWELFNEIKRDRMPGLRRNG